MNAVAFGKAMPLGVRINAIYSSDMDTSTSSMMRDPLRGVRVGRGGHITESDFTTSSSACRADCGAHRPASRGHGGGSRSGGVLKREARRRDAAK